MVETFKQGATGQDIEATLRDQDGVVDLTNASSVQIHFLDDEGETITKNDVEITDAEKGEVKYEWKSGDIIETKGIYQVEVIVTDASGENHFPSERNKSIEVI